MALLHKAKLFSALYSGAKILPYMLSKIFLHLRRLGMKIYLCNRAMIRGIFMIPGLP